MGDELVVRVHDVCIARAPVPMRVTTSQIALTLTSAAVTSAAVSSGATAIVMNGSVSFLK